MLSKVSIPNIIFPIRGKIERSVSQLKMTTKIPPAMRHAHKIVHIDLKFSSTKDNKSNFTSQNLQFTSKLYRY